MTTTNTRWSQVSQAITGRLSRGPSSRPVHLTEVEKHKLLSMRIKSECKKRDWLNMVFCQTISIRTKDTSNRTTAVHHLSMPLWPPPNLFNKISVELPNRDAIVPICTAMPVSHQVDHLLVQASENMALMTTWLLLTVQPGRCRWIDSNTLWVSMRTRCKTTHHLLMEETTLCSTSRLTMHWTSFSKSTSWDSQSKKTQMILDRSLQSVNTNHKWQLLAIQWTQLI